MHGDIKLESELGQGTKTTFRIPFPKAHVDTGDLPLIELGPEPSRPDREGRDSPRSGVSNRQSACGDTLRAQLTEILTHTGSLPKNTSVSNLAVPHRDSNTVAVITDNEASIEKLDRKRIHVLVVEDK